jgi:hypothetical protein
MGHGPSLRVTVSVKMLRLITRVVQVNLLVIVVMVLYRLGMGCHVFHLIWTITN